MKKVLIIGSQGYLGTQLTNFLQKLGYPCKGADIGFFKHGVLYEPRAVTMLDKEARTLEEKDLSGFDIVLMLAGISNDPFGDLTPEVIYDPTRLYALRIAKLCKKTGIRFIFPSSCSVYGIGQNQLDEKGLTNPQTYYSVNKLQVEEDLASISDKEFSPIALRLATVFGISPRMRFDIVVNMLCGLAHTQNKIILNSDGQAWRPHVHIDDVCEAFRCCIEWDYQGGELMVLNVGHNSNNCKIHDIAKVIQKHKTNCEVVSLQNSTKDQSSTLISDKKIKNDHDTRTYKVNFDKIESILPNFKIRWNIESGIQNMLERLQYLQVDEVKFKQRDFYRLQQIAFLYQTKQINDRLFWGN